MQNDTFCVVLGGGRWEVGGEGERHAGQRDWITVANYR